MAAGGQDEPVSITVVVADDQPVVRAGVVMLLNAEAGITVVGEAADGREAVDLAARLNPDVILMDLRMPVLDGATATREITRDQPRARPDQLTKVLVLTTFNDDADVYGALRAGASGFVLKQAAPQELGHAVRRVAAGDAWLDPAVAGRVIAALAAIPSSSPVGQTDRLTAREREILVLMAEGLSNDEIAARLVLSMSTVKTHVARVIMKTGSRDRTQAVVLAYQSGLVTPR